MKVKKLPKDPGITGWNAILPDEPQRPELDEAVTADWLVIGAGFAGLTAARRLSEHHPDDRIIVLEASRLAHGPAGRNSGFMVDLPHDLSSSDYGGELTRDRQVTAMNRAAIDYAQSGAEKFGMSGEAFGRIGKTNAAATEKGLHHNQTYSEHLSRLGEAHQMLDAQAMKEMTGTDYYTGGLFTPGAAIIQPALYIRSLARGITSNRLTIYERSPVVELTRDGASWKANTPKGSVNAPKVIMAVNGHINSFGFFDRQLMPIFTYASMSRIMTPDEISALGGQPNWGVTPADPLGTSVRRISGIGGDRILVRNRFTYDPSMEVTDARIARVAMDHDRAFAARFPMLRGLDMEFRWGGRLCLSRNDVPAFGEVEENIFSACCQNGLGTAKGTLSGMLAADLASGANAEMVQAMLDEEAPQKLPPEPLAYIGANAFIRWGELRAGKEL
ncbi:MAG: FAD-binding oxidoreductase [Pseudomonadota bacterium]